MKKAIIVAWDRSVLKILSPALRGKGYEPIVVKDLNEVEEIIQNGVLEKDSVIIVDCDSRDKDRLINMVRLSKSKNFEVKIVALSRDMDTLRDFGLKGCAPLIPKPFTTLDFKESVFTVPTRPKFAAKLK